MATRANPFYQPQTPIGQGLDSIASLMLAAQQDRQPQTRSGSITPQGLAQADKYRAETEGIVSKNAALNAPPAMLAELFMSGGRVTDDPMLPNPKYTPDQQFGLPLDFDLSKPMPVTEYQPMFQPGRSAQEKMGMAMQEALIRGVPAEDIAKIFAQGGFLTNVNAGTPEAGMPYMPLFGQKPTTNTALTTGRQDQMSARDAKESLNQATTVARIQGQNSANVANINQDGQDRRFAIRPTTGERPTVTPTVTPAIGKAMKDTFSSRLEGMGFKGVDDRVIDGLLVEASKRFQDPAQAGNFKSVTAAVDSVLGDLSAGNLPGFESATQPGGWFSRDKKTLSRPAPAAPAQAQPPAVKLKQDPKLIQDARNAIAKGAPREAVMQRLKDNGIDTKGL
jgi:hypothetical protein